MYNLNMQQIQDPNCWLATIPRNADVGFSEMELGFGLFGFDLQAC